MYINLRMKNNIILRKTENKIKKFSIGVKQNSQIQDKNKSFEVKTYKKGQNSRFGLYLM